MHTLVLGIGNTLLSDEGVGVHAFTICRTITGISRAPLFLMAAP